MEATLCRESLSGSAYDEYSSDAFSRMDESDDEIFYAKERMVQHLDATALTTVESIIGQLVDEEQPVILDLMASWDSHVPASVKPSRLIGLGMNAAELEANRALTGAVVHNLNRDPVLPFEDESFDVVLNTVSVDYLTRPFEVFSEVGRVLKPGGLHLVTFSNRMFPQKATKVWREASEKERILLVEDFFRRTRVFEPARVLISKGKPRPRGDKYHHLGLPSDPIYAIYADKIGPYPSRRAQRCVQLTADSPVGQTELKERLEGIKHTFLCPHCGERMRKWQFPVSPFSTWDTEFMYICFNDECSYLLRGWETMSNQGNHGLSYRLMYDPLRDRCLPVPIPHLKALRDGIVD